MKKNKIHIYYMLLGIGIGLVLGSAVNIISPNVKVREYTDEEIMQKARELGMLNLSEIIDVNNQLNTNNNQNLQNDVLNQVTTNGEANIKEDTSESKQEQNIDNNDNSNSQISEDAKSNLNESKVVEYVEFEIKEGEGSEKVINNLYEANIIDNKEEFIKAVVRRKVARKIHFGKFKITVGADYDTIIDILTN